jgi:hypothetical protein
MVASREMIGPRTLGLDFDCQGFGEGMGFRSLHQHKYQLNLRFRQIIGPLLRLAQHAPIKVFPTDGGPGAEFVNRSIAHISDEKPNFCIFSLKE